jgi:TRAP-type mannitol/chloroaromatic compound transport system permease large subunit
MIDLYLILSIYHFTKLKHIAQRCRLREKLLYHVHKLFGREISFLRQT